MKKILFITIVALIVTSCGTYHYYTPPVGDDFYANPGETHVSGVAGSSGFTAKGGVAITDNISLTGLYSGFSPESGYHVKESEMGFGVGMGSGKTKFKIAGGYGFGSTYDIDSGAVNRNFSGNFSKPYLQFTIGTANTRSTGIKGDVAFSVKFDYMFYNGYKTITENLQAMQESFTPENFFFEPYISASIGGKHVRFVSGTGLALKKIKESGKGIKVFPLHFDLGIYFLFGRKYD